MWHKTFMSKTLAPHKTSSPATTECSQSSFSFDIDTYDWEQPRTRVRISRGYWLGKHANLNAAFDQLRQYTLALENPPLLC